jgi:hypothetical protein
MRNLHLVEQSEEEKEDSHGCPCQFIPPQNNLEIAGVKPRLYSIEYK